MCSGDVACCQITRRPAERRRADALFPFRHDEFKPNSITLSGRSRFEAGSNQIA